MHDKRKTTMEAKDKQSIIDIISLKDIKTAKEYFEIFLDWYFKVILKHHHDPISSQLEADSRILFQMFFTKGLTIYKALDGISYKFHNETLCPIIDPTMLYTMVRNMYETLCTFELLNFIPDTPDKKTITYQLFIISGLKNRQKFYNPQMPQEFLNKYNEEKRHIIQAIDIIKKTELYKSLNKEEQNKLNKAIDDKIYQLIIENNKVIFPGWKSIASKFGLSGQLIGNIYTYFCLNAHPSYISLMQYRDAFSIKKPEFIQLALMAVRYALSFMSIFLVDYIKLFPQIKDTFKSLPEKQQVLLEFFHILIRGKKNSILEFEW